MIKLWFVPEILVFVREVSLKFDFWGRHACIYDTFVHYFRFHAKASLPNK